MMGIYRARITGGLPLQKLQSIWAGYVQQGVLFEYGVMAIQAV